MSIGIVIRGIWELKEIKTRKIFSQLQESNSWFEGGCVSITKSANLAIGLPRLVIITSLCVCLISSNILKQLAMN